MKNLIASTAVAVALLAAMTPPAPANASQLDLVRSQLALRDSGRMGCLVQRKFSRRESNLTAIEDCGATDKRLLAGAIWLMAGGDGLARSPWTEEYCSPTAFGVKCKYQGTWVTFDR